MRNIIAPIAALVLSACALAHAAPPTPVAFPAGAVYRWQERVVPFTYDHAGAPAWMTPEMVEMALRDAARQWSAACGVRLVYAGRSSKTANSVRWAPNFEEPGVLGVADVGVVRGSTRIVDFMVSLNAAMINSIVRLNSTVLHEFGHVVGLKHSPNPEAVMYAMEQGQTSLTPEDALRCRR